MAGEIHAFLGEPFQREQALKEKIQALESGASLGKFTFEGGKVTPAQLQEALFAPSLFEPGRWILLRHADEFSDASALLNLLQRKFSPGVHLLLDMEKLDKRSALFKFIKENADIREFEPLDRRTLPGKIKAMLQERKVKLTGEAFQFLVTSVPPDLLHIENEIKKLSLFPRRGELDLEDVQGLLFGVQGANVFQFLDALGERKGQALVHLKRLLEGGEDPGKMFYMLAGHMRSLLWVKALQDQKLSPPQIAQRGGLAPWLAQRRLQQSQRWTQEELINAIHRLHDEDVLIKQGEREVEHALTALVLRWTGLLKANPPHAPLC